MSGHSQRLFLSLFPSPVRRSATLATVVTAAALGLAGFIPTAPGAAAGVAPPATTAASRDHIEFNHQIKPLLSDRCFACHGPDEKGRKGKLRLDTREGAFKLGKEGRAILVPGKPEASEVIRRITSTDPEEIMPPPSSHLSLTAAEVALLRRWVEQGAEWKNHWAFLPVPPVPLPRVRQSGWCRNEIDRFVLARLEGRKLAPAPEAPREKLLRRVTFDLTGLPPTLAELDAFVADTSPGAYDRVVDRLLQSPAYGERMAVEWLDVARYADTFGYQSDRASQLWPWRDWVISAFNRNVRFNDFILWQVAGDLLPDATREQKLATAFNRNHRQTNEGGSVEEEFRVEYNADRVHTTAGAFLGLTMECARCHDHKYDPITTRDYYRLFAFFNSTDESGLYSHFTEATPTPTVRLYASDAQEQRHRGQLQDIAAREQDLARDHDPTPATAPDGFAGWAREELARGAAKVEGLVGHYAFAATTNNEVPNLATPPAQGRGQEKPSPATLIENPRIVPGRDGSALLFSGENSATIARVGDFKRTDPFSFGLWLQLSEVQPEIVVMHHQQAGSDAGYQGYELVLENGKASFGLIHFWPGNGLKVLTRAVLPLGKWLHVGITYDGSSHAGGVALYVDGGRVETEIVKDRLTREFANGAPLTLGARFRGRGFKEGRVDDLKIFNRCLTALEMAEVAEPGALERGLRAGGREAWSHFAARGDPAVLAAQAALHTLREQENQLINSVTEMMAMGDVTPPRPSYILKRGAYDARGDRVEPGTPDSILPMDPALPANRLGLARWLVDRRNPLTARVIVNRYWQMMFGRGLVLTPENFGSQGALPTHPELLDWMAGWFMDNGWDLKALHRRLALSATYRQSGQAAPGLLVEDPENKLLARGPQTRLTAEMLRDNALAAAGLLNARVGGPSVRPFQPEGLWEEKSAGWHYEPDRGGALYRRSLYTYFKRTSPHPMMTTFDAAERNSCTVRRQSTSTPLQALVLLNDPQFVEAARCIGERMMREGGASPAARAGFAFRLLTSRAPNPRELAVLKRLYQEQADQFRAHAAEASALGSAGPAPTAAGLDPIELAAATAVANTLLSFDEAVFRR